VDILFRDEMLLGLLLNAYAFWFIGQLALLGAIVANACRRWPGFDRPRLLALQEGPALPDGSRSGCS
jgi:hypothetical protein